MLYSSCNQITWSICTIPAGSRLSNIEIKKSQTCVYANNSYQYQSLGFFLLLYGAMSNHSGTTSQRKARAAATAGAVVDLRHRA
jgi:hypothetical protein